MVSHEFEISQEQLQNLLTEFLNTGKNSDVGKIAVKIVESYFLRLDPQAKFQRGNQGANLVVTYNGKTEEFEIKGTVAKDISWQKLKVSSQNCYNALVNGMALIRVTNIGNVRMGLHFMKYGGFSFGTGSEMGIFPNKRRVMMSLIIGFSLVQVFLDAVVVSPDRQHKG